MMIRLPLNGIRHLTTDGYVTKKVIDTDLITKWGNPFLGVLLVRVNEDTYLSLVDLNRICHVGGAQRVGEDHDTVMIDELEGDHPGEICSFCTTADEADPTYTPIHRFVGPVTFFLSNPELDDGYKDFIRQFIEMVDLWSGLVIMQGVRDYSWCNFYSFTSKHLQGFISSMDQKLTDLHCDYPSKFRRGGNDFD